MAVEVIVLFSFEMGGGKGGKMGNKNAGTGMREIQMPVINVVLCS